MRLVNKKKRTAIRTVAEMRSRGLSWEAIATQVPYAVETIRRWPDRYGEEWERFFRAFRLRLVRDYGSAGRTRLRLLVNDDDKRLATTASRTLCDLERQYEMLALKEEQMHREDKRDGMTPEEEANLNYLRAEEQRPERERLKEYYEHITRWVSQLPCPHCQSRLELRVDESKIVTSEDPPSKDEDEGLFQLVGATEREYYREPEAGTESATVAEPTPSSGVTEEAKGGAG